MTLRTYQPSDEAAVIELWQSCDLVVPWNDPHEDIQRKLRVQPELFLVGSLEERIIASIMAGYDGHRGWLYSLAVLPGMQRRGLGRQIVEEAVARLARLGCHKVNLQVRASNAAVIGFYEALGFSVEDRLSMGRTL